MSYLSDAANRTPDPDRSLKNFETFITSHPDREEDLKKHLDHIAHLFACSQYLAHYSVKKPDVLFRALGNLKIVEGRRELADALSDRIVSRDYKAAMKAFRDFKKEQMIKITARDIMDLTDTVESMEQLSDLADAIIDTAFQYVEKTLREKYGEPEHYSFAVFALGKLGAQELNYSSDVDLIFVYGSEKGHTSGVRGPSGALINSIGNHEFYCRLVTEIGRFLSQNTEDGFVYRVDMRLRPDGERGDAALSLRSYELYYESWGREWERLALIRARPVCGDTSLSSEFLDMITPFVWRKYIDYSTIDEIRGLKTKIDATFKKDDIKRGYGGIREIEFFIQSLQLIYAGKEPMLRQRKTLIALYMLKQKNLIGDEDYALLSESYIYLRRIEHYLQMLNDVQTHTIPSETDRKEALARKAEFITYEEFNDDLQQRRTRIRDMYNLLFKTEETEELTTSSSIIFEDDITDDEIKEYVASKGVLNSGNALKYVNKIKENIEAYNTLKGRRLLRKIMPSLVEKGLSSAAPDRALKNLLQLFELISTNESYLITFSENTVLMHSLVMVFSQSDYLSKIILSNPVYLDMLSGGTPRRKTLSIMKEELSGMIQSHMALNHAIRLFKKSEEIRLGLLFLNKMIHVRQLIRGLTKVAEAVVDITIRETCRDLKVPSSNIVCIAAMGKFGGREITIGSDLDILFYVNDELAESSVKAAQRFLRVLQAYTRDGIAYKIDTRLRPDGTKGVLINSIRGYRDYYLKHAGNWEIQALLKARPVSASREGLKGFMEMRKEIFVDRAQRVSRDDILNMRKRIMTELVKPETGIDIKLHRGGIEEIEFLVQYLELRTVPERAIYHQDTMSALKRIGGVGMIDQEEMKYLSDSYLFFRTVESYLRLSMKNTLREDDAEIRYLAKFMDYGGIHEFLSDLKERMVRVAEITDTLYEKV